RTAAPTDEPLGPVGPIRPLETRRWYERRGIQATLVGSALAAVVGAILIVRVVRDDTVLLDPDGDFVMRWGR
ncbi:MAG: hypothetical protein M3680_33725, partial [Myxococcota bacterium]|nr:hypothetical protein [Myxococcota bacterium]